MYGMLQRAPGMRINLRGVEDEWACKPRNVTGITKILGEGLR
jgi:hypothetical protein